MKKFILAHSSVDIGSKKESGFSSPFILLSIAAVAALLIYASGILNKNQKTNQEEVPKQTEEAAESIKDVPNPVNEFLNNNDIKEYEEVGMKIYTGNNPPNIEGLYKSDSLVIFYDKPFEDAAPPGVEVTNYNHQFYDQESDGTIKLSRKSVEGDDEGVGMGGFISGDNNCFSIFVNVEDQFDQCNINEATIYSACKTEEGLEQLQVGFITKEKIGPGCGETVPVGHLRIIVEDDGLTELIEE
ncbi:MAG: hypothetical protein Q8P92_02905 [Candidatus Daviesbacteria bacterium]|nr:hypothetical protein [Candidatus Daviesbacteria bacterium]